MGAVSEDGVHWLRSTEPILANPFWRTLTTMER
jgi:hypothetical protein